MGRTLQILLVQSEDYLLACYRYIELNPVRAGMVSKPAEYRWSSYHCNALNEPDRLIQLHPQYLALGRSDTDRHEVYRSLFTHELSDELIAEIRSYVQQQKVLGSARFQSQIEAILGRHVQVRPAHRPKRAQAMARVDNGL